MFSAADGNLIPSWRPDIDLTECTEIIGINKVSDITSSAFLFYENKNEGELLEGRLSQKFTRVVQRELGQRPSA